MENCNGEISYHNEALNHKNVGDFIAVNAKFYKKNLVKWKSMNNEKNLKYLIIIFRSKI